MPARKKRNDVPKRFRVLRDDASIKTATKQIEEVFRLPQGSVRLVYKNGRKARTDSTVERLREDHAPDS